MYAYVRQNPWTTFDPHGLAEKNPATAPPNLLEFFDPSNEKFKGAAIIEGGIQSLWEKGPTAVSQFHFGRDVPLLWTEQKNVSLAK